MALKLKGLDAERGLSTKKMNENVFKISSFKNPCYQPPFLHFLSCSECMQAARVLSRLDLAYRRTSEDDDQAPRNPLLPLFELVWFAKAPLLFGYPPPSGVCLCAYSQIQVG